jgi:HK97 family phage prohead protease
MTATTDPYLRAVEILEHRKLCLHEAGHCAAGMLTGLDVHQAQAAYHTLDEFENGDPESAAGAVLFRGGGDARAIAIMTIAGPLNEDRPNWPPRWPLTAAPTTPDEKQLAELVKRLDLDRAGYDALVSDALDLACSREFNRLAAVIADQLEQHHALDAQALNRLKAITEGATVEHMTLEVKVTETAIDRGEFEAVISTGTVDRDKDIVEPQAMVNALAKWATIGKLVPLAWAHTEDVVGHIDPASARVEHDEVIAKGWVDQSTPRGEEAWRLVKSGTLSFSFGYLVPQGGATKRPGGRLHIRQLDVFEISLVPVGPANNDTRVLGWKSLDTDLEFERFKRKTYDDMRAYLGASAVSESERLRAKAAEVAREFAPIQVARFEA